MVSGTLRLCDNCLPVRVQTGQENGRLYLSGSDPGMAGDSGKRAAADMERGAVISIDTLNISPHPGKRLNDTAHGTFLDGCISGENGLKGLRGKNAGEQAHGRAAVAAV